MLRERKKAFKMGKTSKEDLFENYPVPKAVAKLAIPTVAACLVMVLYNLADTFFVGRLNDPLETSAVTLAAPVLLAFNAVTNLFGTGCSSMMSRALGLKDYKTVRKSAAFGFYCAIFCGVLFSLLATVFHGGLLNLLGADETNQAPTTAYLFWTVTCGAVPSMLNVVMANLVRAEGSAMHASIGTMSGCVLNIILDPFFIMPWGLGMGAAGAGLATFISNCVACIYYIILVLKKRDDTFVSMRIGEFWPTKKIASEVFGVGIPASIQNLLNVTGMTIMNNFMAGYGTEAVSAMGITHKVAMVPMYISMGIAQGILPLVGYNFASGNRLRMKETIRFTEKVAGAFMVLAACASFVFAEPIIGLFMKNALIVEYGGAFMKGASLAMPFLFIDFLAVGIFQACGMGRRSLVFAILRKIVLEIPAMIALNRLFPMYGLAYAQLVAEFVLAIAALIIMEKIMKEKT